MAVPRCWAESLQAAESAKTCFDKAEAKKKWRIAHSYLTSSDSLSLRPYLAESNNLKIVALFFISMDAERPGVHTSTPGSSTSATSSNPSSLAGSSSFNCSESPRPHSGCGSATSHSDNSDAEIEFNRFQHEVPPASCSTSNTVLPSTPPKSASPGNRTIPRSTPQRPCHTPSGTSGQAREPFRRATIQTSSHWLSKNTIGIISLAASLSSLIFLGVRTYKLAVSQTINTALSTCINLIQVTFPKIEFIRL